MLGIAASALSAEVIVLDFEGLTDLEPVQNFYNGGSGGSGSGPGPNYGITFGSDALVLRDQDEGGNGNISNEPSGEQVLFFLTGPGAIMNVNAGFTTGFSFQYATPATAGTVTVYEGLNGTGNILAQLALVPNGSGCGGDPTGQYNCWTPVGVTFSGTARSVNFSGTANFIVFDDVTLGSAVPGAIPEPASIVLAGAGLGAVYMVRRRRKA